MVAFERECKDREHDSRDWGCNQQQQTKLEDARWLSLKGVIKNSVHAAQLLRLGMERLIVHSLSGLLGIGSGALKVIAMDRVMRLPFKVSTTTSNFMIGVTAAASAGVYLSRGYIDPALAMPVMLGVLIGSLMGTRVLVKTKTKSLRLVFSLVIVVLGIQMLLKGLSGSI